MSFTLLAVQPASEMLIRFDSEANSWSGREKKAFGCFDWMRFFLAGVCIETNLTCIQ